MSLCPLSILGWVEGETKSTAKGCLVVSLDKGVLQDKVAATKRGANLVHGGLVSHPTHEKARGPGVRIGIYDSVKHGRVINMGLHGMWVVAVCSIWLLSPLVPARRLLESAVFSEFAGNNSTSSRLLKKHDEHIAPPA